MSGTGEIVREANSIVMLMCLFSPAVPAGRPKGESCKLLAAAAELSVDLPGLGCELLKMCRRAVFVFVMIPVFKNVDADCWGKYQYYNGREGTPCNGQPLSLSGNESCGFQECDVGYYCQAKTGECTLCNNSIGIYPNFAGYYSSPGTTYDGNDCEITCPLGYRLQDGGDQSYWIQDKMSLKWTKYTYLNGQCRRCQNNENCYFDNAITVCGGQDKNYFGWMGKLLFTPNSAENASSLPETTPTCFDFGDCRCPPGYVNNFSAVTGLNCGSALMGDGNILYFSCCDFVGYLLYTDQLGQAKRCTSPWPQCISSDERGLWQYLLPCRPDSDRRCVDCNNPNKPSNSHYVQSPRTYPGIYECRWVCNTGFFESAGSCVKCSSCGSGLTMSQECSTTVDTQCSPCPPAPPGAYFPVAGSCAWNCTPDYFPEQGSCALCPEQCAVGFYRTCGDAAGTSCANCSVESCAPCTNRPPNRIARFFSPRGTWEQADVRSFYTGAGGWRANNCAWTCDIGYYGHPQLGCAACTNRPDPLLPVENWTCQTAWGGGIECFPAFANSSYYTGPGTFDENNCPWACVAGYQQVASNCEPG